MRIGYEIAKWDRGFSFHFRFPRVHPVSRGRRGRPGVSTGPGRGPRVGTSSERVKRVRPGRDAGRRWGGKKKEENANPG